MNLELFYLLYLVCSFLLTLWVGKVLHSYGKIFLKNSFHDNPEMGQSINNLLRLGFYLLNFGLVCLFLNIGRTPDTRIDTCFKWFSHKFGIVFIILGILHIFNLKNISLYGSLKKKNNFIIKSEE